MVGKDEIQLSIFNSNETQKQDELDKAVDKIKEKFGYDFITRAGKMNINEIVQMKRKD